MKLPVALYFLIISFFPLPGQNDRGYDFLEGDLVINVDPYQERIDGKVSYRLKIDKATDSVFLDAREMNIKKVQLNGRKVKYKYDGRFLTLYKKYRKDKEYSLEVDYSCTPKQAVYFLGWQDSIPGNEQVWTQGQGKYNSHWVPSFDLMSEKVRFDLKVEFPKNYKVIANGKLIGTEEKEGSVLWHYKMIKPMSSYLLAFVAGKYESTRRISNSGTPIDLYFYPQDSLKVEPTYRFTTEIFNMLEREIGVPYPWQNYKQVPVRDFLYAGMENTGTTIFSDAYVIDSIAFSDRNYVNVNAHEFTHQWFGNLVTEKDASSHWLHEGFATYYSWLAEKELLGEDYFYWMLLDKADVLEAAERAGQGASLLDPNANSLTFYDKGAMALLMLQNEVGEQNFKRGIKSFLTQFSYQNASVDDFLSAMEASTGTSLVEFRQNWLESTAFPEDELLNYLRNSYLPVDSFFKLRMELISSAENNEAIISKYWEKITSSGFRARMILLYHRSLSTDFLKKAFRSNDREVRKALSSLPGPVSDDLIREYESLLTDRSYVTLENALYKLWIHRPASRKVYLDKSAGISGFSNRNIRQLWLLLAILTSDYLSAAEREEYKNELFSYTAEHYPMEVRQLAFQLIREVFPYEDHNLRDLVNAALHPAWQFRQLARTILRDLISDDVQKKRLNTLLQELEGNEYEYLSDKLNRE
ncbi:M1 family metallopeptidase [Muriicola soli]|uniref:Aminopeptidase N n=1 Tax=Muriicola soli TaxID=2507538 RepID=A0A411E945_9FLAO|nr:M1 family metallopeptidase [Muriicola soli]QBA64087.1 M1 family peptidase [Muriicola soli]